MGGICMQGGAGARCPCPASHKKTEREEPWQAKSRWKAEGSQAGAAGERVPHRHGYSPAQNRTASSPTEPQGL